REWAFSRASAARSARGYKPSWKVTTKCGVSMVRQTWSGAAARAGPAVRQARRARIVGRRRTTTDRRASHRGGHGAYPGFAPGGGRPDHGGGYMDHEHHQHHHHHDHHKGGLRLRPTTGRAGERRALLLALGLTTAVMILELVGGVISHSLALRADAGHML